MPSDSMGDAAGSKEDVRPEDFLPTEPSAWLEGIHFYDDRDFFALVKVWWPHPSVGPMEMGGNDFYFYATRSEMDFRPEDQVKIAREFWKRVWRHDEAFVRAVAEITPNSPDDELPVVLAWSGDKEKPTLASAYEINIQPGCEHPGACECPTLTLDISIRDGKLVDVGDSKGFRIIRPPLVRA